MDIDAISISVYQAPATLLRNFLDYLNSLEIRV